MTDKDLYSGLIRLHVLHHACQEPIFGAGVMEELARHGYKLSPGTVYPLLHGLEEKGYLKSRSLRNGRQARRIYNATSKGKRALTSAKAKVQELFGELFEGEGTIGQTGSGKRAVSVGSSTKAHPGLDFHTSATSRRLAK